MSMRPGVLILGIGWWACTAPKNGGDRMTSGERPGGFGGAGSGRDAGLGSSAGGAGAASPGDGRTADTGSGGSGDDGGSATDSGSNGTGSAGAGAWGGSAGAGASGGSAGAGAWGGSAGAGASGGDDLPCEGGCPLGAPVCSNGECHAIKQIAPGSSHACALIDDGTVRCWGDNAAMQLGDGSQSPRLTPGDAVIGVRDVVQLSSAGESSCAVTQGGAVWCWGWNLDGRLGVPQDGALAPFEVPNLGEPAAEVSFLAFHTCARMVSGKVKCWGSNLDGALGNGTREPSALPVEVTGLTDAAQIAVGRAATCAVRASGTVLCWGYNGDGRLATGSSSKFVLIPEQVVGLSAVHMIDGAEGYFCAVAGPERRVMCWGEDYGGALGDGPPNDRVSSSVVDTTVVGAQEVRTGGRATCARVSEHVFCWGANNAGQLGIGDLYDTDAPTTRTLLASPAASVGIRFQFGCALLDTGQAQCWGGVAYNGSGRQAGIALAPEFVVW